jgi:hypothetical protein
MILNNKNYYPIKKEKEECYEYKDELMDEGM